MLQLRKQRIAAIAEDGTPVVIDAPPMGRKEVENAIRKTAITPSDALEARLMESIQSNQA